MGGKPFDLISEQFYWALDFFLKNGRAAVYPIYKGTYERTGDLDGPTRIPYKGHEHAHKEYLIKWVKDFRRTLDYLESRPDFDSEKIAFYGLSWGAVTGTIIPAVEARIGLNILYSGGFRDSAALPEAEGLNYISRITVPTLMFNGRHDTTFPLETHVRPAFELLGTSEPDKKLLLYETDHNIPIREVIKESLAWLDHYFGPVN
jgi:dienelactone hydrolase